MLVAFRHHVRFYPICSHNPVRRYGYTRLTVSRVVESSPGNVKFSADCLYGSIHGDHHGPFTPGPYIKFNKYDLLPGTAHECTIHNWNGQRGADA